MQPRRRRPTAQTAAATGAQERGEGRQIVSNGAWTVSDQRSVALLLFLLPHFLCCRSSPRCAGCSAGAAPRRPGCPASAAHPLHRDTAGQVSGWVRWWVEGEQRRGYARKRRLQRRRRQPRRAAGRPPGLRSQQAVGRGQPPGPCKPQGSRAERTDKPAQFRGHGALLLVLPRSELICSEQGVLEGPAAGHAGS